MAILAQTILTLDAGTHKTIRDGGDLYLLIQSEDEAPTGGASKPETKVTAPAVEEEEIPAQQEAQAEPAPAKTSVSAPAGKYTEAELMQDKKSIQELLDILDEMGVNPADFDGKNTNKKLRLLILDAQEGKIVEDEPAPVAETPATPPPARGRGRGTAPAPQAGPRLLTEDEANGLDDGDMVIVKLDYGDETDGVDPEKLWDAEVIGWKVPDGDTVERLHVKFQEDGAEDWIRDGDELYEFKAKI